MQTALVFVIVAAAAVYAGWKFIPAHWRLMLARKGAALAQYGGVSLDRVQRLESKLASAGTCGSCDSCNACGKKNMAPTTSAPYIRIHSALIDQRLPE